MSVVGSEAVGVLEPDGHFVLLALADGRTIADLQLAVRPQFDVTDLLVTRMGEQYIVLAHDNRVIVGNDDGMQPQGMFCYPVRRGRFYALDLQGKLAWPAPVDVDHQHFLLGQPGRLPVLCFAAFHFENNGAGQPRRNFRPMNNLRTSLVAVDRRNGRIVYDEDSRDPIRWMGVEIHGDPEQKTVRIAVNSQTVNLTFTNKPVKTTVRRSTGVKKARGKLGEACWTLWRGPRTRCCNKIRYPLGSESRMKAEGLVAVPPSSFRLLSPAAEPFGPPGQVMVVGIPKDRIMDTSSARYLACRQIEESDFPRRQAVARLRNPIFRGNGRAACLVVLVLALPGGAWSKEKTSDKDVDRVISRGLDWLASRQSRLGHWTGPNGMYPTAITGLSSIALLSEGSTTTQGKYSANIQRAVNYLVSRSNKNGLIGSRDDDKYTYGHGFSMLFLSQVLGEEEDADRRKELIEVLTKAVKFSGQAQATSGGWGYVSAKDQPGFDEGSTTITQVQGLRGCRNAGIPVPKEVIEKAVKYIRRCMGPDGGVAYNSSGGGGRPPITAAAIACLFNAGEYDAKEGDKEKVETVRKMMKYCDQNLSLAANSAGFAGHWHYANYYYSQVLYRTGGEKWNAYHKEICSRLIAEVNGDGFWEQGYLGAAYTTAMNLTILQLERGTLPIYQR